MACGIYGKSTPVHVHTDIKSIVEAIIAHSNTETNITLTLI